MNNKVTISNDKNRLSGTLFFPKKINPKNPAVIFLHGWTSTEEGYRPRAEALVDIGCICLTFTLRGHEGKQEAINIFSRKDHLDNTLAAYDFLVSQPHVDSEKIGIVGASYGAYLGAIATEKRNVQYLAMRAPAFYLNDDFDKPTGLLINNREEEFFQNVQMDANNFALSAIKKYNGELLLIESEKDQIIPHKIIEIYKEAFPHKEKLEHKIIKNADHQLSDEIYKQEFIDILVGWFNKKL